MCGVLIFFRDFGFFLFLFGFLFLIYHDYIIHFNIAVNFNPLKRTNDTSKKEKIIFMVMLSVHHTVQTGRAQNTESDNNWYMNVNLIK